MKKSINLNSKEWCDVVFRNKNKSYGAYEMRMTSSKRHIAAFGVTILFATAMGALPAIISEIKAQTMASDGIDETRIMMNPLAQELPKDEVIEIAVPEPPKELMRNTVIYVAPVIAPDDQVLVDAPPSIDEVLGSRAAVGRVTFSEGTDDVAAPLATETTNNNALVEIQQGPLVIAEIMPQFPGGEREMMTFIGNSIKYPIIDLETGTQGRVTVRFVVSKTGKIDDVQVIRGVSPTIDREAMRVVKSMPTWIPGKQNGRAVDVYFILPMLFRLK